MSQINSFKQKASGLRSRFSLSGASFLIISFFLLVIIIANYTSGTYLLGWDSLSTEFNPWINLDRTIQAAWQEYQGLGLLSGLAHASDLPRQIFVLILTWFLPLDIVRYFENWVFLVIGVFGMYYFVKNFVLKDSKSIVARESGAVIAALFYLLNLGTVQTFYLPLELFTIHYAALPLLALTGFRYLTSHKLKDLLIFSIFSVMAATQAYTQTVFLVYLLMMVVATLSFLVFSSKKLPKQFIVSVVLGLAIILTNIFWILPFLRFFGTNSVYVPESRINSFASEAGFLQNKQFGSVENILLLKGFWFGNQSITEGGEFTELMPQWVEHMDLVVVQIIGFLIFFMVLLGIIALIAKVNRPIGLWLIIIILLGFIFLGAGNPPFGFIYDLLRENPLLKEALRFPFTKFSIMQGFAYSIGLGVFAYTLAVLINKIGAGNSIKYSLVIAPFVLLLTIFSFPSFQGFFISPYMRVNLPEEYLEMFDFFAEQPKDNRILNLPVHTHWGWTYHNWGYQGSGFIWFGIEQPIVDRAFDVWSPSNEQFYREFRFAYYSNDIDQIESIIQKYDINWIIWDKSKFIPGGYKEESSLNYTTLKDLMLESDNISLVKVFGENIEIYKYDGFGEKNSYVKVLKDAFSAGQKEQWYDVDPLVEYPYFNSSRVSPELIAPFKENNPVGSDYAFRISEESKTLIYNRIKLDGFEYKKSIEQNNLFLYGNITNDKLNLIIKDSRNIQYGTSSLSLPENSFYIIFGTNQFGPFSVGDFDTEILISQFSYNENSPIDIRIYDELMTSPVRTIDSDDISFDNCDPNFPNGSVEESELSNGKKRVYVENTFGCSYTNIYQRDLINRSLLAQINLEYQADQTGLSSCIVQDGQCLGSLKRFEQNAEVESGNFLTEIPLITDQTGIQINADDIDRDDSSDGVYFDIGDIRLKYFELIDKTTLDSIDYTSSVERIELNDSDVATVSMTELFRSNIDLDSISTSASCFDRDSVLEVDGGGLRFIVEDKNNCLTYDLEQFRTDISLLFAIDFRKNSGREPEVCVLDNASNTCILTEKFEVKDEQGWNTNYFILPKQSRDTKAGYSFIVYNWATGADLLDYAYKNFRVYSLDDEELSAVYSTSRSILQTNFEESYEIIPISSSKYSYNVKIPSIISDEYRYLVLNQGYDSGWVALSGGSNDFVAIINAIIGREESSPNQSYEYKGWANIWDLNQIDETRDLYIVYAPQYLIWIGWIITFVWILSLVGILAIHRK